jgi:hypothetical protein
MCLSPCSGLTNTAAAFSLTTVLTSPVSVIGAGAEQCNYDFLAIPGGQDQATFLVADRYCGDVFPSVCSMLDNIFRHF